MKNTTLVGAKSGFWVVSIDFLSNVCYNEKVGRYFCPNLVPWEDDKNESNNLCSKSCGFTCLRSFV